MDERRENQRAPVAVTVDVRYGEETLVCVAADLSVGGVRLADLPEIEDGQSVELLLYIDPEGEEPPLEVPGTVVWTSQSSDGSYCGVEFGDIADETGQRLKSYVDGLLNELGDLASG